MKRADLSQSKFLDLRNGGLVRPVRKTNWKEIGAWIAFVIFTLTILFI